MTCDNVSAEVRQMACEVLTSELTSEFGQMACDTVSCEVRQMACDIVTAEFGQMACDTVSGEVRQLAVSISYAASCLCCANRLSQVINRNISLSVVSRLSGFSHEGEVIHVSCLLGCHVEFNCLPFHGQSFFA